MRSKAKYLSAAALTAVLLTTLAVARTVHTPTASGEHAIVTHGKVTGSNPAQSEGPHLHGIITCGPATSALDCDRLEMLLPMSWAAPQSATKSATKPVGI